jgi:hypothetical protein
MIFGTILNLFFEPVFTTIGVLFFRIVTFGKFPKTEVKGNHKILFEFVGLLLSVVILILIIYFFF